MLNTRRVLVAVVDNYVAAVMSARVIHVGDPVDVVRVIHVTNEVLSGHFAPVVCEAYVAHEVTVDCVALVVPEVHVAHEVTVDRIAIVVLVDHVAKHALGDLVAFVVPVVKVAHEVFCDFSVVPGHCDYATEVGRVDPPREGNREVAAAPIGTLAGVDNVLAVDEDITDPVHDKSLHTTVDTSERICAGPVGFLAALPPFLAWLICSRSEKTKRERDAYE